MFVFLSPSFSAAAYEVFGVFSPTRVDRKIPSAGPSCFSWCLFSVLGGALLPFGHPFNFSLFLPLPMSFQEFSPSFFFRALFFFLGIEFALVNGARLPSLVEFPLCFSSSDRPVDPFNARVRRYLISFHPSLRWSLEVNRETKTGALVP